MNIKTFFKLGFLSLLSVLLLCSCLQNTKGPTYQIQGTFFGSEPAKSLLLLNKKGNIQKRATPSQQDEVYKFNLSQSEALEAPFYVIYAFDKTPQANPRPPFVQAIIQSPSANTGLPAILVFDAKLKLSDTQEKDSISFIWEPPAFSKTDSRYVLKARVNEDSFFEPATDIKVAYIPYDQTSINVNLKQKMTGSNLTLQERLKKACTVSWYLELPYDYPEGFKVIYASSPVEVNYCK